MFCSHQALAEVYKYKDSEGNVHYVDNPAKIPERYRKDETAPHKLPNITRERGSLEEPLKADYAADSGSPQKDAFDVYMAKVENSAELSDDLVPILPDKKATVKADDDRLDSAQIEFLKRNFKTILITGLVICFIYIISMWTLLERRQMPGFGLFVPIYNMILISRLGGFSGWWILWLFIPVIGSAIWGLTVNFNIAKSFGRGDMFAIGTALFPFVFIPFIAMEPVEVRRAR